MVTKYKVVKYWDDMFDGVVAKDLTEKQAKELATSLRENNKSIYTSYEVKSYTESESNEVL